MWVFGYGSLVWKADFKYECKLVGYIKGYQRRFYQHSIDHRGVPEKCTADFLGAYKLVNCGRCKLEHFCLADFEIDSLHPEGYSHLPFPEKMQKSHCNNYKNLFHLPGRVVTLIPSDDPDSSVWGVAYKIKEEDIEQVTTHLDYREKNGYSKKSITFHPKDTSWQPFELTLYVAMKDNESYAGPASIEDLAMQVISCGGPSGSNKEYVYNLAEAMRQLAPDVSDDHLFSLEATVRKIDLDMRKNS